MSKVIRIGVASAFMYPDINRLTFGKKTLCFIEKDMANFISKEGVCPILIPDFEREKELYAFLADLDAFVFQGGNDLAPETYGEEPIGEWKGDIYRDRFELKILDYAIKNNKAIFGICRGAQLINAYFGGTLYQDILTQRKESLRHRDALEYDQLTHDTEVIEGSYLYQITQSSLIKTNSVHHQAIKKLGKDLECMAICKEDGLIEAFQWKGTQDGKVMGMQWHPEFEYNCKESIFNSKSLFNKWLNLVKS